MTTVVKVTIDDAVAARVSPPEQQRIARVARQVQCGVGVSFPMIASCTDGGTLPVSVVCEGESWLVSPKPARP